MKRGMAVIRNLMLQIEASPDNEPVHNNGPRLDDHTQPEIDYHIALRGAAFFDSIPAHSMAGRHLIIRGLTSRGHEFLDSVHNETVWDRCKELINEKDGSVPFDVLQNLLVSVTSNLLDKT